MKHVILYTLLAFGITISYAQQPIKAPTRPAKTASASKPAKRTTARHSSVISNTSVTPGLVIDLGLSVKWASHNVGANSPEEYGGYYGWADPTGEKTSTNEDDYPCANPPRDICATEYDIAHVKWGGSWRLPTSKEITELIRNCSAKTVRVNNVLGIKFTSKKNGKSIFLPYSGTRFADFTPTNQGDYAYYWSGTHFPSGTYVYQLCINRYLSGPDLEGSNSEDGKSVRPVTP